MEDVTGDPVEIANATVIVQQERRHRQRL